MVESRRNGLGSLSTYQEKWLIGPIISEPVKLLVFGKLWVKFCMRKKRFPGEQIVAALKQPELGVAVVVIRFFLRLRDMPKRTSVPISEKLTRICKDG